MQDGAGVAATQQVVVTAVSEGQLLPDEATTLSNVDRAFLAWAIQIEIQQQDMGRIAERRARTSEVRELGDYLVARHQQAKPRLERLPIS